MLKIMFFMYPLGPNLLKVNEFRPFSLIIMLTLRRATHADGT